MLAILVFLFFLLDLFMAHVIFPKPSLVSRKTSLSGSCASGRSPSYLKSALPAKLLISLKCSRSLRKVEGRRGGVRESTFTGHTGQGPRSTGHTGHTSSRHTSRGTDSLRRAVQLSGQTGNQTGHKTKLYWLCYGFHQSYWSYQFIY